MIFIDFSESKNEVCQAVSLSQTQIAVKIEEEAKESRTKTDERLKSLERQQAGTCYRRINLVLYHP